MRHVFEREQFLPIPIDKAWSFFSDPRNLAKITPASLDFQIISPVPDKCHDGLIIEYRVRPLLGIPVAWVSLITDVREPFEFVDTQTKGPYRYWHHRHHFTEVPGGVSMKDVINYELPMEWLFPWLNQVVVAKKLQEIFDFRHKILSDLFKS